MPIKQLEQRYAFLNDNQLQDPIDAIFCGATGDRLFNDRTLLFEIFYAALGSEAFEDHEAEHMREYTFCWERTIIMVEACHRLIELRHKDQFHYSYSGDIVPK